MYRVFIIILVLFISSFAREIKPAFVMKSKGLVNDFVIDEVYLYVANSEGSVEIFDIRNQKKVDEILIEPSLTTKGDLVNPKVLSVDRHNGKTLIVSTDMGGYRNVWLHDGKRLHSIISAKDKKTIKEARFVNDDDFMFGTLGYDVVRYTATDDYSVYSNHIEESSFSDMVLSEDRKSMVSASESGKVKLIDIKSGNIIKEVGALNLDNIYKLAYKNGNVLTAGQDRRVGVYPREGKAYYIESDFLVYSVGLSPSGKLGVYSSNEKSDLQLFDVKTGKNIHTMVGHDSVPSTIEFFNEDGFFSAGYGYEIYYWHLGK